MFGKRGYMRLIAAATIAILAIGSVAYAALIVDINTNDMLVDPAWIAEPPLIADGIDATANYDIIEAWVGTHPTGDAYYFRVTFDGTLQPDYSVIEARLDCDLNGLYTDAADMIVYYQFNLGGLEEVVECQGRDYWDCAYATPNTSDLNPVTFGEPIPGTPTNYEWKGELISGIADWSQCLGSINVQFAALDGNGVEQDVTDSVQYIGIPTAVSLVTFNATASADHKVLLTWETASELDIVGFNLYRAEAVDGQQAQLNADLIPGQMPGSPSGAAYEHMDETVQPGATYWYWLEGVDAQGAPTRHGPVSATVPLVEVSHSIYLPLVHK